MTSQRFGLRWFALGLVGVLVGILCTGQLFARTEKTSVQNLSLWTRADGLYGVRSSRLPGKQRVKSLSLSSLSAKAVKLLDVQYGVARKYRVLRLSEVIKAYQPGPREDLALLHFANGVMIPYPLKLMSGAWAKKYPVYIATGWWDKGTFRTSFPSIHPKGKKRYRDVRSISFSGNKVVVTKKWHPATVLRPDLHLRAARTFRPWSFAGSLIGIELVRKKAYFRQFPGVKTRQERKGLQLHQQLCQFCHGVRGVGAKAAWDFVLPRPIYLRKGGFQLYYHIKVRSRREIDKGAMMPGIRGMTIRDAFAIWNWLRAEAKRGMKPYQAQPIKRKPRLRKRR